MKEYYHNDLNKLVSFIKPTFILKNEIGDLKDIQKSLEGLRKKCNKNDRLLITYYNHLWEPLIKLASFFGLRKRTNEQNWLDNNDIENILALAGWDVITQQKRLLVPLFIPFFTDFINRWISHLPIVNSFCLTTWVVARPKYFDKKNYSVSIIIPARNEAGNISRILKSLPKFGKWQELLFVEGHSKDDTWRIIQQIQSTNKSKVRIRSFKQKGIGKADAVRLGFAKARGDLLMILDADLTVDPRELPKFYNPISNGHGEFINGSRLVYPMEKDAMRILNKVGNKVFSWLFTWILGQRFKDTLCGTKALLKSDYVKIARGRKFFGNFDPFGDFDLIFGAVKQNLKVVEIPVRYYERKYGSTNISRFKHGLLLGKMTWFAFNKFRAW